jgi:hypothetical protein
LALRCRLEWVFTRKREWLGYRGCDDELRAREIALVGARMGAGVTKADFGAIVCSGVLTTGALLCLLPCLLLVLIVSWGFVRSSPRAVEGIFQPFQFASAALM